MYLQTILKKSRSELVRKVYEVQKMISTKNDWFQLVEENRRDLEINKSDEEIETMSKERFKLIVNKSVEKKAIEYLNNLALKHEKAKPLIKEKLTTEKYFLDPNFTKSEIELLFALRTRMVRDIKNNFPHMYNNNMACEICKVQICSQEHLLKCVELQKHLKIPEDVEYLDIFRNTEKQLKIVKIIKQVLRVREILKCK